jgi:putative flippase GtrA
MAVVWSLVPGPARRWLQTNLGRRFGRFILVAAAAVIASQVMLTLTYGIFHVLTAFYAGVVSGITGALVSYVLSRKAWERSGKPDLLRETLPFFAVTGCVLVVLGLSSHYAGVWGHSMHLRHWKLAALVDGAYFLANCFTFLARFVFFHYVLFAGRGTDVPPSPATEPVPAGPAPKLGTNPEAPESPVAAGEESRVTR